jgi:hypothetical protein
MFDYIEVFHNRQCRHSALWHAVTGRVRVTIQAIDSGVIQEI